MSKKTDRKEPHELNLIDGSETLRGETCFSAHKELGISCTVEKCRYWQNMGDSYQNCVINASARGSFTLQEVGDIFSVTRMRICQIEKTAKEMLKCSFQKEEL